MITSRVSRVRGLAVAVVSASLSLGGIQALMASSDAMSASGAVPSSGGAITIGYDLSAAVTPVALDPVQFTGPAGFFPYNWPVFAGLLRETTSGAYLPDLASKVTIADPSTIDISLRPGLTFSDGTPLNAAAVKAGFERNLTNSHSGAWLPPMYTLSSIDVTGSDSLVLHFNQPDAASFYPLLADEESFMALPTGPSTGPVNTNIIGAGPFVLKSYSPSAKIVLTKNPKYWDAKNIRLRAITFVNVSPGPQQVNALTSGLVQADVGLPISDVPSLQGNPGLQVNSTFPDASFYYVPICKSSGPLAQAKVRQALSYATNRVAINRALLFGKGQPAWSIFPSSSVYYDRSLTNIYAYNVKKAKQLLAAAGYPNGFSTTLMALPSPGMSQLATVLQSEWKQIGVSVQIIPTTNYVTDLYRENKAQLGLNPSGLPGIEKITTQYIPGSVGDFCGYDDTALQNLANQIQATPPNSPKLTALWKQAQQLIIKPALSVYIDYAPIITAATKSIKNLQVLPYEAGVLNYWVVSTTGGR